MTVPERRITAAIAEIDRRWHRRQMNLRIRLAGPADIAAMHRLRSSVRENRLADPQRVSEGSYLPYVEAGTAWVAETEGAIAGFAILDAPAKSVWALFIDPGAEGAGIGRALHQRMIEWAQAQGLGRLTLTTGHGTRAAKFYRRAGWTDAGATSDGELIFEKRLSGG